jgi:O-antigen/teichoic acid export membrane protein
MPAPDARPTGVEQTRPRGHFHWPTFAADAGLVTGGALLANALNYVFHFILSRRLGPTGYGELATLLAAIMVVGVIGSALGTLAMQETARLWTLHRDDVIGGFWRKALLWSSCIAAAVALIMSVIARPLSYFLHITDWIAWSALAAALFVGIITAAARGAAQGAQRFVLYASSLVVESTVKLGLGFALAAAGFGAGGALWGAALGLVCGGSIAVAPMLARTSRPGAAAEYKPAPFVGPAFRLSVIYAASTALLYVDLFFAKHALSGTDAGYYGAAGQLARVIPFGAGLIVPLLTPKAVAARHADRAQLSRLLAVTFGAAAGGIACVLAVMELWPGGLILFTFGKTFAMAAPLLRIYALDDSLIALGLIGYSYLAGIGDYAIAAWLIVALAGEAICMAAFGDSPLRLLTIAIVGNAAVLPPIVSHVLRSLRGSPQAPGGRFAEQPLSTAAPSELPLP